jgi:hypothetical protein
MNESSILPRPVRGDNDDFGFKTIWLQNSFGFGLLGFGRWGFGRGVVGRGQG